MGGIDILYKKISYRLSRFEEGVAMYNEPTSFEKVELWRCFDDTGRELKLTFFLSRVNDLLKSEDFFCRNVKNISKYSEQEIEDLLKIEPELEVVEDDLGRLHHISQFTFEEQSEMNKKLRLELENFKSSLVGILDGKLNIKNIKASEQMDSQYPILNRVVKKTLSVKAIAFLCYYLKFEGAFMDERITAQELGKMFAPAFGRSAEEVRKYIGKVHQPGTIDKATTEELKAVLQTLINYIPEIQE